ncbi:hypothetical protein ACV3TV_13565 [Clostridium perfringens]
MLNKFENLLEYVLAFTIIINANTIWAQISIGKINLILMLCLLIVLGIIASLGLLNNKKIFIKTYLLGIFIFIFNFIFIIFNGENKKEYIISFLVIFILCFIYSSYKINIKNRESILNKLSNLTVIIALISLIMYLFGVILNVISQSGLVTYEWGVIRYSQSYHNIQYITQNINLAGRFLIRNTSIFTEAPMYAFILSIALLIQLFKVDNLNKIKIGILLITIFTTFSTIGIVFALGLVIIKYLLNKPKNKIRVLIKSAIFPIVVIIAISIASIFIISKINETSVSGITSYSVRLNDFKIGFDVWKDHKFVGIGFNKQDFVQLYMSTLVRGKDMGGSSGIMTILAQGGTYLLVIYLIPFIGVLYKSIKNKDLNKIIIAFSLMTLLLVINIPYKIILIYFLATSYAYIISKPGAKKEVIK